jgi:hypothetical protein
MFLPNPDLQRPPELEHIHGTDKEQLFLLMLKGRRQMN